MVEGRWAKTANRSVIGVMNEFSFLATESRRRRGDADPIELALWLAQTDRAPDVSPRVMGVGPGCVWSSWQRTRRGFGCGATSGAARCCIRSSSRR